MRAITRYKIKEIREENNQIRKSLPSPNFDRKRKNSKKY